MEKTIILIHEVYGITDNLVKLSDYLKKHGYKVIIPNLYSDNYSGNDEEYCYKKFFYEVGIEKAKTIIDDIIKNIISNQIVLIGFSIGATIAWLETDNPKITQVIGFYGTRIRNYLDILPRSKTNLFFCNENRIDVNQLANVLRTKKNVDVQLINGEHGFYSKEDFYSEIIEDANKKIIKVLNMEDF